MSNPSEHPTPPSSQDPVAVAQRLLRACVHCGFCNATCPTYQLTGDEREGPRGRLYLMKDLLAGAAAGADLAPLAHCLGCRSCETTCPAGVHYGEILDTVREHTEERRPALQRALDRVSEALLGARTPLATVMRTARALRPIAPKALKQRILPSTKGLRWPAVRHARRVGLLIGCIQPALRPDLDVKAAIVLDHLGISAQPLGPACCGALPYHLQAHEKGRARALQALALGTADELQGVTSTATGCTAFLRDYGRLLQDTDQAARAQSFAATVTDLAAWIDPARLPLLPPPLRRDIAWHAPCSLQHALKGALRIEAILQALGHKLVPTADPALCCGSAGPYSLRHPRLARALGRRKWQALTGASPALVVTANIGCQQHLASHGDRPVVHWLDLVYEALTNPDRAGRDSEYRADPAPPSRAS